MMRTVVFLCRYQAPYGGNFIASLRALEASLAKREIRCVYLLPAGALARPWCRSLAEAGSVIEPFTDSDSAFRIAKRLRSVCRTYHASIVHVHFGKYAATALAAIGLPRLRLVWHYHSDFSANQTSPVKRVKRLLRNLLLIVGKRRIKTVAVSPHIAAAIPFCKALPNALAPTRLTPHHAGREETRAALGLTESDLFVLLFGWSPFIKGADLGAEAVALLRARGIPAVLGLVGGREYPPDAMRAWLKEHASCTEPDAFVVHLLPTEDVFSYHAAADVLLSASRSEAFGYTLLEAIHSLTPCAVTDLPGMAYLTGCPTVFFAKSGDAASISDAVAEAASLARDPARAGLLAAAKADMDEKYALGPWIHGIESIYGLN